MSALMAAKNAVTKPRGASSAGKATQFTRTMTASANLAKNG
jgi:hypothetical protein